MDQREVSVSLHVEHGYRLVTEFGDGLPPLTLDEQPPVGEGTAPDPSQVLASAVAGCLSASLLFCLRRARVDVAGLTTEATARLTRNDRGRWRISDLRVELHPDVAATDSDRLARCMSLFEDFCIVTESVRRGIPVEVLVAPPAEAAPVSASPAG